MGIQIMGDNEQGDATMTVELTGRAIRAYYFSVGSSAGSKGDYYYTGAQFKGKVTLSAPGRKTLSFTIDEEISPDRVLIPGSGKDPEDAPFGAVWRKAILRAFARLWGPPVLVPALWPMFSSAEEELKQFGHESLSSLIQAFTNNEYEVDIRVAAAKLLGQIFPHEPKVVIALTQMLNQAKSADIRLRKAAALSLGIVGRETGDDKVVESLVQALQDESCTLRMAAADALCQMRSKAGDKAVSSLIQALEKNETRWMRLRYVEALNKITGQNFWDDVRKWKQWQKRQKDDISTNKS